MGLKAGASKRLLTMRTAMQLEKQSAKKVYLVMGIIVSILTLIWSVLQLVRVANIQKWNSDTAELVKDNDYIEGRIYD